MNFERGFIIYNKLVGFLGTDRQMFLFVTAAVSIVPIMYYLSKNSKNMLLSIIIYLGLPVFLLCFSGLRHAIAIGITSLSMIYIKEKSLVKFILLVLLASTFHFTAIVFLIAYPITSYSVVDVCGSSAMAAHLQWPRAGSACPARAWHYLRRARQ